MELFGAMHCRRKERWTLLLWATPFVEVLWAGVAELLVGCCSRELMGAKNRLRQVVQAAGPSLLDLGIHCGNEDNHCWLAQWREGGIGSAIFVTQSAPGFSLCEYKVLSG